MFRLDEVCFAEPFRFSRTAMRRYAEAPNAHVLIAEQGPEIAGFVIVHRERIRREFVAYLLTIDIAPSYRRHGLAQRLLAQAEEDARTAGCIAMLLHVFTENQGAIALYEKCGYERLHITEGFYARGLDAWVFRKKLARDVTARAAGVGIQ